MARATRERDGAAIMLSGCLELLRKRADNALADYRRAKGPEASAAHARLIEAREALENVAALASAVR